MGCLDLRLKIGSYSKFFLALSPNGLGPKGGIIPLLYFNVEFEFKFRISTPFAVLNCKWQGVAGLGQKGGIIPKHKGILGSLQFQENKERSCVTHNLHQYSTRSSD